LKIQTKKILYLYANYTILFHAQNQWDS